MKDFDETEAVKFINSRLSRKYPADEILNVIDMIWDYYETNGMLEIDDDDDMPEEDIETQLVDYVTKMLGRDPEANVNPADVPAIVSAELDYEEALEEED